VRWQVCHDDVDWFVKIWHQLLVHHVLWLFVDFSHIVVNLADFFQILFLQF
jgi:hypothetical protein